MILVYDIETLRGPDEVEGGWENPEGMGFASAVAYSYLSDQYYMFLGEKGKQDLLDMLNGNIAISFNGSLKLISAPISAMLS